MEKLKSKEGFTLIEMVVALLILVMIIVSMDTVMDSSLRIYNDATFEADSASMAGIVNTNIGDILRYVDYIKTNEDGVFVGADGGQLSNVEFVFTSYDYGVQDAYFYLAPDAERGSSGVLQMRSLKNAGTVELVNTGAYPNLAITDFDVVFTPNRDESGNIVSGYFEVTYTIFDVNHPDKTKDESCVVRLMNA